MSKSNCDQQQVIFQVSSSSKEERKWDDLKSFHAYAKENDKKITWCSREILIFLNQRISKYMSLTEAGEIIHGKITFREGYRILLELYMGKSEAAADYINTVVNNTGRHESGLKQEHVVGLFQLLCTQYILLEDLTVFSNVHKFVDVGAVTAVDCNVDKLRKKRDWDREYAIGKKEPIIIPIAGKTVQSGCSVSRVEFQFDCNKKSSSTPELSCLDVNHYNQSRERSASAGPFKEDFGVGDGAMGMTSSDHADDVYQPDFLLTEYQCCKLENEHLKGLLKIIIERNFVKGILNKQIRKIIGMSPSQTTVETKLGPTLRLNDHDVVTEVDWGTTGASFNASEFPINKGIEYDNETEEDERAPPQTTYEDLNDESELADLTKKMKERGKPAKGAASVAFSKKKPCP